MRYFERGDGPALVLAHGWLTNANLWRHVVGRLHTAFRCITLDLPLGAHETPMPDADLTPLGVGRLIAEFIRTLGVETVTLVGNDSGGAYSQIATALAPQRVAQLVLNSCETPYDDFPPAVFAGLKVLAQNENDLARAFSLLRDRSARMSPAAFGLLVKRPIPDDVFDSYALPLISNEGILRDAARVMRDASPIEVARAGERLIRDFDRSVWLAFSEEERVFSLENARRYTAALRHGHLELLPDGLSFTPEDQPERLAKIIARCAATRA